MSFSSKRPGPTGTGRGKRPKTERKHSRCRGLFDEASDEDSPADIIDLNKAPPIPLRPFIKAEPKTEGGAKPCAPRAAPPRRSSPKTSVARVSAASSAAPSRSASDEDEDDDEDDDESSDEVAPSPSPPPSPPPAPRRRAPPPRAATAPKPKPERRAASTGRAPPASAPAPPTRQRRQLTAPAAAPAPAAARPRRPRRGRPDAGATADQPLCIAESSDDEAAGAAPAPAAKTRPRREQRLGPAETDPTPVFQYPPGVEANDSVDITRGDLRRLEPDEFLNDNLVDFYLKVIVADARRSPLGEDPAFGDIARDVHAFSSVAASELPL